MACVCIYANGKPECLTATPEQCIELIVEMTGISTGLAKIFFVESFFLNSPVSITGPFDLFVDYWEDSEKAPFVRNYHELPSYCDEDDNLECYRSELTGLASL